MQDEYCLSLRLFLGEGEANVEVKAKGWFCDGSRADMGWIESHAVTSF